MGQNFSEAFFEISDRNPNNRQETPPNPPHKETVSMPSLEEQHPGLVVPQEDGASIPEKVKPADVQQTEAEFEDTLKNDHIEDLQSGDSAKEAQSLGYVDSNDNTVEAQRQEEYGERTEEIEASTAGVDEDSAEQVIPFLICIYIRTFYESLGLLIY